MRGLTHHFSHRNMPGVSHRVETSVLGQAQPRDTFRAVAIDPFYLIGFLPGDLHQVAKKSRLVDFSFDFGFHADVQLTVTCRDIA